MLLAIGVGLAVKTPTVPFHTWLPPAHTDAPATGSAILAGVLLKMGTYGFVRIAMPILPEAWRAATPWSSWSSASSRCVYGALVALAQTNFKRMIAYTSVNHMGYIVLAVGAAGHGRRRRRAGPAARRHRRGDPDGQPRADHRRVVPARRGAVRPRAARYDMDAYSGLAAPAPAVRRAVTRVAAFASLGLPGFSGFIAEFQIFTGSLATAPVATAHRGARHPDHRRRCSCGRCSGSSSARCGCRDAPARRTRSPTCAARELLAIVPLLALAVVIGVAPRFLLDVIEPASRTVDRAGARDG